MPIRKNGLYDHPVLVNDFTANLVTIRLFVHFYFLALQKLKNPVKALRYLVKFAKKRKTIQGYDKISRYVKSESKYYFADQIPGFPSKALDRFLGYEIDRLLNAHTEQPMLNTLIYSITSRCPLQCVHCFEWDNIQSSEHLKAEDLVAILEKVKPLGLTHIQFGGGEPLVRLDDLLLLIEKASPEMDCWILTSGFGLTQEKALRLKQAGLTGASISLDHWDEQEHNRFRNHEKSFYWVKEAVKNCHNSGIMVNLALCATKQFTTPENIDRYYKLATEWGVGFVKILEARKTGRFRNNDVLLTPDQVKYLMEFYLKTYSDKRFKNSPIFMFPGFDQRQTGCLGAGNRYMYIDSRGEVHACPFCHRSAGNILEHPAGELVSKLRKNGCQIFHMSNS